MAAPFQPSCAAPASGLATWSVADPTQTGPPLPPGTEVEVLERSGDWAKIRCSNDWTAWVDARYLVGRSVGYAAPVSAPVLAPAPRSGGIDPAIWKPLVGAAVIALSGVLPWTRGGGSSSNAFDIPAVILVNIEADDRAGPTIGVVVLVIAVLAAVAGAVGALSPLRRACGIAAAAVAFVYAIQIGRLVAKFSDDSGYGFFDAVHVGIAVAAIGGLWTAVVGQRSRG